MLDSSSVTVVASTSNSSFVPLYVQGCAYFNGSLKIDLSSRKDGSSGYIPVPYRDLISQLYLIFLPWVRVE